MNNFIVQKNIFDTNIFKTGRFATIKIKDKTIKGIIVAMFEDEVSMLFAYNDWLKVNNLQNNMTGFKSEIKTYEEDDQIYMYILSINIIDVASSKILIEKVEDGNG